MYTLHTLEKIKILISKSLGNLSFTHRGIAEEFIEERDNFVTINDISKFTNSIMTIPNLWESGHFEILNNVKKLQIFIFRCIGNMSFNR